MVGSIKSYLTTFQKKTDFRPDDQAVPGQTEACQKVVGYIVECRRVFDQSLDGKNLEVVLLEFGIRIQRVIYDHIQQYVVSETGRNVFDSDVCVFAVYFHFHFSSCVNSTHTCTHRGYEYYL